MRILFFLLFPSLLSAQGDYEKTHANFRKAQSLGLTGVGVKIAILEVGGNRYGTKGEGVWVDYAYGYDFVDNDTVLSASSHHGNFVLSIINSSIGLAPNSKVYFLKVANDTGLYSMAAIHAALQYCIDSAVNIVNISIAFNNDTLDSKIAEVIAAGIIVVASSGNQTVGEFAVSVPATLPDVIAVNSITSTGAIRNTNVLPYGAVENSHGINIAASGASCEVIGKTGVLVTSNGTSFSAPFIVGTFALYKQRYPTMSNNAVMQLILDRAIKQTNTLFFGAGRPTF